MTVRIDAPRPRCQLLRAAGFVLLYLFSALLLTHDPASLALAQQPTSDDEVIRVDTHLVSVPLYVTDGRGRRVSGLTRADFAVSDEGAPVELAYFAAGAERVALAFLLDASGSARDIIARQREAALGLFSLFGQKSRVAVIHFREAPELVLPFTRDSAAAGPAFRIAARPDSRTAIFDAASAALRAFDTGGDPTERRIAILISDGLDTVSTTRAASVIEDANARGVSFYVIHLPLFTPSNGRLVPRPPSKGFRDLAEKTGGQFFMVGDARSSLDPRATYDLTPVFQAIAADLQSQYVLGYYASGAKQGENAYRRVDVRLNSKDKRKLRAHLLRGGYRLRAPSNSGN